MAPKKAPIVSEPEGNTRPRLSASKNWCFTYNNYTEDILAPLNDLFLKHSEIFVYQEEIGEECGTPHLQGQVVFKSKLRPIETFGKLTNKISWRKTKDLHASIKYCCKVESRKENGRIWCNFPLPKELKLINPEDFYPYQEFIMKIVTTEPDDRKIYWFVDEEGNNGKSCFTKYLCAKYHAIVLCGKATDMKNGILNFEKNKGFFPEIILIDLPRTFDNNYLSYTGIEEIKNGCFFSPKYEGGMCIFNNPHIIIFSNEYPKVDTLSKDRWYIKSIKDFLRG